MADGKLSIERCKEVIGTNLSDKQIEVVRDALYVLVEGVLDAYFDNQKKTSCPEGIKDLQIISNNVPIE